MVLFDATDRRLLRLAGPAFLTLSAEPIYILVDTAIVGHLGTTQLGGLAIAGTVLSTLSWLIGFLATGVTTQVAQRRGAGDELGARTAVSQGLFLATVLGFSIAALIAAAARPLVALIGGKGAVLEAGTTYLRISALGFPAIAFTFLALGWFRGIEDLRIPVRIVIGANVANIVLEMLFVWVFKWGLRGSAIATVLVQWGAVVVYLLSVRGILQIQRPRKTALKGLLSIGVAMIIRTGMMVSTLSGATWLATRVSDSALGAHQIGVQIWLFFALMVDALAISSQSVFANQMGQGITGELWPITRRLMRLGLIAGVFLAMVLVVGSPILGRFFSSDNAVRHASIGVLLWCALMQLTGAVVFVLDGVLMGADLFGRLAVCAVLAAGAFWVVAVITKNGPTPTRGLAGVWLALNLWMLVRLIGNTAIAIRHLRMPRQHQLATEQ
jgi:putative MATE family efflux protein